MSITFSISPITRCEVCTKNQEICDTCWSREANFANANASAICGLLDINHEYGSLRAIDLKRKINVVMKQGFSDCGEVGYSEARVQGGTANYIYGGRREGYLTEKLQCLLKLCDLAGDIGRITWG